MNDLKYIKLGVIALLLFGMVIGLTGIVCADQVVPAVPETQALSTVTTADVVGLAMETDAGAWTLTNDPLVPTLYTFGSTHAAIGPSDDQSNALISAITAAGGSLTYSGGTRGLCYYQSIHSGIIIESAIASMAPR